MALALGLALVYPQFPLFAQQDVGQPSGVASEAATLATPVEETVVVPVKKEESWISKRYKQLREKKQNIFAKLRPVGKALNPLTSVPALRLKTTVEELYNKDFVERMRNQYRGVEWLESKVFSPYRRARPHEVQQYENSRSDMVRWTAKEMLNSQVKELFRKADGDSSAMHVLGAVRDVTGAGGSSSGSSASRAAEKNSSSATKVDFEESNLTQDEKIYKAHILDVPATEQVEESIPTRLKTRLNIIRGRGSLNFINPIVSTSVDLKMGRGDNVTVDMHREFKDLTLSSNVRYAVDAGALSMSVNKKIVDNIYLDINSIRYNSERRSETGEKNSDRAQLTYSIGF